MRVKIFEPCYKEYDDLDKPVYYSEDFLRKLASQINKTNLVEEKHFGKVVGDVSNLTFTDGALYADVNTDKALDNLKYSPYIDCSTVDKGDYWLAENVNGLIDIALTGNPNPSVKLPNTKGGSNMGEENDNETIKILNKQVKDLNKDLVVAQNKNKANEDKLKQFDEMEKELKELREWKETNSKLIEEQKPIIEKYNQYRDSQKEELLNKLSDGNEEIKAKLKDKSLEDLQMQEELLGLHHHDQPAKGIGANHAQGLNKGSGETDEETERTARNEAVESMFGDLFTKED